MRNKILEAIKETAKANDVEVKYISVRVEELEIEINFDLEKGVARYCFESYGEAWNTDVEDDLVVIQVMDDKVVDEELWCKGWEGYSSQLSGWEDDQKVLTEVSNKIKEKISAILKANGFKFK